MKRLDSGLKADSTAQQPPVTDCSTAMLILLGILDCARLLGRVQATQEIP